MQSKLSILCAWYHDGIVKDRSSLRKAFLDMTAPGRHHAKGSQTGYAETVTTCAMAMGKDAAAEMATLWRSTSIAMAYFHLQWSKLADDVPRQVRVLVIFNRCFSSERGQVQTPTLPAAIHKQINFLISMRSKELALEEGAHGRMTQATILNEFNGVVRASDADKKRLLDAEKIKVQLENEKAAREAAGRTPEGVAKKRRLQA